MKVIRNQFSHIPVSSQGQVTLPKAIREQLGIKSGSSSKINFIIDNNGTIVIESEPTVDALFGILKPTQNLKPANIYELREDLLNERLKNLGYPAQNN